MARDERVTLVPATLAKGLEFDSVVVVDPARIVATEGEERIGLRRLYVVLTRAVSSLTVLHDDDLPAALADHLMRYASSEGDTPPVEGVSP